MGWVATCTAKMKQKKKKKKERNISSSIDSVLDPFSGDTYSWYLYTDLQVFKRPVTNSENLLSQATGQWR